MIYRTLKLKSTEEIIKSIKYSFDSYEKDYENEYVYVFAFTTKNKHNLEKWIYFKPSCLSFFKNKITAEEKLTYYGYNTILDYTSEKENGDLINTKITILKILDDKGNIITNNKHIFSLNDEINFIKETFIVENRYLRNLKIICNDDILYEYNKS